jgi:hypothetical protein
MIKTKTSPARLRILLSAALSAGCALALAISSGPTLRASGAPALQALDDKAPALPLTATFTKVEGAESGPYVLKLENTSKDALKVTAQVLTSLPSHAEHRTRDIPEHVIEAGQAWSIPDLAATDKVTVRSPGFAPLELTVP